MLILSLAFRAKSISIWNNYNTVLYAIKMRFIRVLLTRSEYNHSSRQYHTYQQDTYEKSHFQAVQAKLEKLENQYLNIVFILRCLNIVIINCLFFQLYVIKIFDSYCTSI